MDFNNLLLFKHRYSEIKLVKAINMKTRNKKKIKTKIV